MKIFVSGGQFFADGFAVRRAFCLNEGEKRLLCYVAEEGCGCSQVSVKNGRVTVDGRSVLAVRWAEGVELRPAPHFPRWLTKRARTEVASEDSAFLVECIAAPRSLLRVTGAATAEWEAATTLLSPRLDVIEGQKEKIVKVSALCPEGEYLAMIALHTGAARLLLEDFGESVSCRGNEVTVRRRYADLMARERTSTYLWQGEGFAPSHVYVCANDHSFKQEEMGRLLLEAALAKDKTAASALLSPEVADADALFDYFGPILAVEPPLFESSPTAVAALCREGEGLVATLYDFDFDSRGKIKNVRRPNED